MTDKVPSSILEVISKQEQKRRLQEETGLPLSPDSETDQITADAVRRAADLSKPVKLENSNK